MKPAAKRGLVAVAVLLGAAAAIVLALYGSAVLFLLMNRISPSDAGVFSVIDYWAWYRGTPLEQKLKGAIVASFSVWCVLVPIVVASALSRRRSLHGDARFARPAEIRKSNLYVTDPQLPSILVGKHRGKWLGLGGQRFVMLSAPTRAGKGVGAVIPNLLNWPHTVVVNDIKDECFKLTAGFRAANGQRVYRWAPFDAEGRTCQYNPLAYLNPASARRVSDVLSLGLLLYPDSPRSSGSDQFFNDQARNLFLGFVLYLLETPERPRTMGQLLRMASGDGKGLKDNLSSLIATRQATDKVLSDECVQAFSRFLSAPENTLGSILSTFNAVLTMWADEVVDAAIAGNSFDLRELRRVPMSVYVHVPANRRGTARLLVNLFFSQLVELNTDTLPEDDASLAYQVLLVMDEFPSLNRVGAISESIAYLAGYNIRLLTITQSHAQLVERYGEHEARNFVTNHGLQILYTPRDMQDAEEYSKRLGYYDLAAHSKGRSSSMGMRSSTSTSTNVSQQRRALMLPQEFRSMPFEQEVIDLEGCRPILADKILYYEEEVFRPRLLAAPRIEALDLAIHRARIHGRVRAFAVDEIRVASLDHLAHDFSGLPALAVDASDGEVEAFVDAVFSRLAEKPSPVDLDRGVRAQRDDQAVAAIA